MNICPFTFLIVHFSLVKMNFFVMSNKLAIRLIFNSTKLERTNRKNIKFTHFRQDLHRVLTFPAESRLSCSQFLSFFPGLHSVFPPILCIASLIFRYLFPALQSSCSDSSVLPELAPCYRHLPLLTLIFQVMPFFNFSGKSKMHTTSPMFRAFTFSSFPHECLCISKHINRMPFPC
jgi:hypothetical protein